MIGHSQINDSLPEKTLQSSIYQTSIYTCNNNNNVAFLFYSFYDITTSLRPFKQKNDLESYNYAGNDLEFVHYVTCTCICGTCTGNKTHFNHLTKTEGLG